MRVARAGAIVAAATLLVVAGSLAAPASQHARLDETYTDKVGDGNPDITGVRVSHDAAGGLSIALTVVDLAAPVAQDTRRDFSVYVEPDDDTSPASPPFDLFYDEWPGGAGCQLLKDNGTSYMPTGSPVSCAKSGDTVTWSLRRDDLGAREMFSFYIWSGLVSTTSGQVLGVDRTPEFGRWGYHFTATTPTVTTGPAPVVMKPVIGRPTGRPARAIAGRPFTVVFPVRRSDTGAPLAVATIRCDPTIGGRLAPHSERFLPGKAQVVVRLPRTAGRKTLRVQLQVTSGGRSAVRTAAFPIAAR
jgi:hypothetical protein